METKPTEIKKTEDPKVQQATTVSPKTRNQMEEVRAVFTKMENEFQAALPNSIEIKKFMRCVLTAVQNNPSLLTADRKSLYSAAMMSAQDGLIPDGREAALVVYKVNTGTKDNPVWTPTVKYLPMIAGVLKKVRNSGELASICSQIVYRKEFDEGKFRYWVDSDGEHLEHHPIVFGDRGEILGAYALAKTKDGAIYIEVMREDELQAVRKVSKSRFGPWDGPFADEMRKKSVTRRLCKRLPSDTDVERIIHRDDDIYDLEKKPELTFNEPNKIEYSKQPNVSSSLGRVIEAQAEEPIEDVKPVVQTTHADEIPLDTI